MDITRSMFYILTKRVLFTVVLLFIVHPQSYSGNEYTLIDKNLSWTDAIEFCKKNGTQLADLAEAVASSSTYECLERFDKIWTEKFASATPYSSMLGCFSNQENLTRFNLSRALVLDCQYECSNSSFFAISDKECSCLENVTSNGDVVDASLCNITCDGIYCGGQDTVNIYHVVNKSFFQKNAVQRNPNFTSCLSYQCLDHRNVYKEADCDDASISQAECSNYFSCTFEPGVPCFLYQDDQDDFDWTIQNETTKYGPERSYEGSYFAFVDDEQYSQGKSTVLVSNVGFSGGQWCIQLRYYIQSELLDAKLEVFKTGEEKPFFTFNIAANKEWKYVKRNIGMTYDERFTRGKEASNFAIDDVTVIKGSCDETVTALFKMKGEINCDFEGNADVCFQPNNKGFTWKITRDGSTPTKDTGPDQNIEGNYFSYFEAKRFNNGEKAVLISSFYLEDINISYSMQYSMYGKDIGQLYVYLKDEWNTTTEIFKEEGDKTEGWNYFIKNITAERKNKLYIEGSKKGKGNKGDIAIDDIKIRINKRKDKKSWLAFNERCARILGSYIINIEQITDLPCMSNSLEKWTGIIRPQRRGSAIRGFQETPAAVQLYRNINNVSTYDWEMYDPQRTRPFVCKRGVNSSGDNHSCVVIALEQTITRIHDMESTDTNHIGVIIAVVACGLTLIVGGTLGIVYYRRMQRKKKQQNSPTVVTVYDYSDETLIFESYSSNETNVKKLKSGEIPQDSGTESGRRTQEKRNIIETTRSETEYDHLHQKNGPSTSAADNMYSRMEDNQHGPQSLSDDTYDHTFGMESKCTSSQINHSVNDFYDQAHVSEKMTSTTDDFYTHVTGDQIASRNILLDYTYDRTVEIESTCRYGTSLGDNNINNIYDQAQILTETLDSPKNNYQDPETFYDQAT